MMRCYGRGELLDVISEYDDDIMELMIEETEVPAQKMYDALRQMTLAGKVQPTYCGASLDYIGVQPVLDGVTRFLPSPLDRPAVTGEHPNPKKNKELQTRKPDAKEPVCWNRLQNSGRSAYRAFFFPCLFWHIKKWCKVVESAYW